MTTETLFLVYLFAGILVGFLTSWLIAKARYGQLAPLREELSKKDGELRQAEIRLAAEIEKNRNLEGRLAEQAGNFEELRQQSQLSFENAANRLLEEKSQRFAQQNQTQIQDILTPLREKIREFEAQMEKKFLEDAKDKLTLKLAIEQLRDLNAQLSDDATRLATALKGDNKAQGDWGEYQLELLLERSGLEKDTHFQLQPSFKDEEGRDKRPDCILFLPGEKHLIIDSKVSLVAYERFYNSDDEDERRQYLRAHVDSIRQHVKGLSEKQYPQLSQLQAPDYTLLFVPLEGAFTTALREDQRLFLDALEKNIVMVTSSTLLATLRTVSYIWKQEKQKNSVMEIARQGGLLYDKFAAFVEDLRSLGQKLDAAQGSYQDAMNKLTEGKKAGDTLVGRAERIRQLGAKTSKSLPADLLGQLPEE